MYRFANLAEVAELLEAGAIASDPKRRAHPVCWEVSRFPPRLIMKSNPPKRVGNARENIARFIGKRRGNLDEHMKRQGIRDDGRRDAAVMDNAAQH